MNSIKDLTPNVEHINCDKHIWANWKKKDFKGENVTPQTRGSINNPSTHGILVDVR